MQSDIFWLLTLLILSIGFSIQPLRELWRKLRASKVSPPQNETRLVQPSQQVHIAEQPQPSEQAHPSEPIPSSSSPRASILKKYNIPSSYLGYLSRLNNEELEEWAKAFFAANDERRWQ